MNKFLFLMTHIGANSGDFCHALTSNSEIEIFRSPEDVVYKDYESLRYISSQSHKAANSAAIYVDEILYNYKFHKNMIVSPFQFIFYLGEPRSSVNRICQSGYGEEESLLYYLFRLQGMYEYIVRTKGVISTWQDWKLSKVSEYLGLREQLSGSSQESEFEECVSYKTMVQSERAYEDFLFKTTSLDKSLE